MLDEDFVVGQRCWVLYGLGRLYEWMDGKEWGCIFVVKENKYLEILNANSLLIGFCNFVD